MNSIGTRVIYLDTLRATAIVAVVLLHIVAGGWYTTPVTSDAWQWLNLIDSATRFCVPVFFMVSGAIFLDPEKATTVSSIYRKSIPRVAIPFATWSIFYACISYLHTKEPAMSAASFLINIVLGHYHLWFLIALAGLYLATPILRQLVLNRAVGWYFVVLAGVFALVFPILVQAPVFGSVLGTFLDTMKFEVVLGYSVYFVLGYLLHTIPAIKSSKVVVGLLACLVVGVGVTALGTAALSLRALEPVSLLYDYLTPNVCLAAVAVFLLHRQIFWQRNREPNRFVGVVGTYSFGIYLVHPLFLLLWQNVGLDVGFAPPYLSVPVVFIAVFLPSLGASALIRLLPRIGTYLA